MKVRFPIILGTTVAALAAALVVSVAQATGGSAAGAEVRTQLFRVQIPVGIQSPCTGDPLNGEMTLLFHETLVRPPGGPQAVLTQFDSGHFQATGDSGSHYVGALMFHLLQVYSVGPGPYEIDVVGNPTFHVVRTGEDGTSDDFFLHANFESILDLQTGMVKMQSANFSSECR
jgi:hypothetical protein